MSQNVELLKAALDLYQREGPASLLPMADPEIEVYTARGLVNVGTYRGHEEYLAWSADWLDAWEDFKLEALEFIELGDSIVVVPVHQTAKGRGSGISVEMDVAYLVEIIDGKVTRFHLYESREEAVEAAERLMGED
jgi:ketosteroid isomerase-like protein